MVEATEEAAEEAMAVAVEEDTVEVVEEDTVVVVEEGTEEDLVVEEKVAVESPLLELV